MYPNPYIRNLVVFHAWLNPISRARKTEIKKKLKKKTAVSERQCFARAAHCRDAAHHDDQRKSKKKKRVERKIIIRHQRNNTHAPSLLLLRPRVCTNKPATKSRIEKKESQTPHWSYTRTQYSLFCTCSIALQTHDMASYCYIFSLSCCIGFKLYRWNKFETLKRLLHTCIGICI